MELGEFQALANGKAPPHLKDHPFITAAVVEMARKNKALYPAMLPEVLQQASVWYERYTPPSPREASGVAPTPRDFLAGERLVEKISPLVRHLREEVFSHGEAPFETVADAASWVEWESEADLRDWREDNQERDEARKEIKRLAQEHCMEFDEKHTFLTYQRPGDEHVKHAHAIPNTRLYRLAKETKRIAKRTGLPEDAFTMHVLTSLRPMLSRVRIKTTESVLPVPNREQVISRWVEAKIFAKDLNDKELRTIYRSIRKSIGSKGDKRLTTEEQDFWELMETMGAPPDKDKGKFWEEALRRWKELHPDTNINSRDGVKRKYERLSERLDRP